MIIKVWGFPFMTSQLKNYLLFYYSSYIIVNSMSQVVCFLFIWLNHFIFALQWVLFRHSFFLYANLDAMKEVRITL
jgi:hypothetical protein